MSAIKLSTPSSGSISLSPADTASNLTITVPASTTTMVGTNTTQTLTNKTIEGGTVISGTAVASTSGTSINFTGIPSWAKRITVMLAGVSLSGSSSIIVQLGSTTFTTTGYVGSSGLAISGGVGNVASYTTGFGVFANAGGQAVQGMMSICLVSGNVWVAQANFGYNGFAYVGSTGGTSPALSGSLDRIRITSVNGTDTFDAGSINILYE
jgi:hypothetical protein